MGVLNPGTVQLWCPQTLIRAHSTTSILLNAYNKLFILLLILLNTNGNSIQPGQDATHITAILGESVIFNCHVEFPGDHPVPYVLQWEKKGQETPIYIWYESYPTHSGEGYEGRVSRVSPDSPFGAASLNLTNIRESDQGWYECKVVFLNRSPNHHKNGTWFHLDVHAPPRFSVTPEDIIYVNLGDSIILNCQADGTPTPEILWYKDANPVEPSSTTGIFNDGTELRISTIRHDDIGDYTCIARNGEGQVSHTARVIIAGGAVIMVPPINQTKLEGEKVQFTCEAKAMPGNVTVRWFREGAPVREVAALETRVTIRKDGTLIINPVSADDSGWYTCEVSNGIGDAQSAAAFLNVELTFTPTIQYLPFRLAGVVQCYIKANPPLQYVTWTKDKRLLEPYQTKDIVIMNNGSLLFTRVNQNHQGRYTCTPYNAQGTQGSSGQMEVLVRKPPSFIIEPDPLYQRKVGEAVEMNCDALEAEGTSKPTITWQRRDGQPFQRNRVKVSNGNLTIENLRRSDFGYYECVASNEVATIISSTQLIIEGTQPHAPYNLTATATEFSVTLSWMPGYSGGPDYKQDYVIWYREAGISEWSKIPVTPSGSTQVSINRLSPGTTYEFQVVGNNQLGEGMMSKVMTIRTLDSKPTNSKPTIAPAITTAKAIPSTTRNPNELPPPPEDDDIVNFKDIKLPTDSTGSTILPSVPLKPTGPKPGQPRNLTVTEISNGFLISWQVPLERAHLVQHYTIKYRTDASWKTLNRGQIRPEETSYLVKNLVGGRTYYFRVLANSLKSYESSDEVKFPVPARVKHKAITAGVVGGILFFIVAIILSICAVKICNKRKRRKQEKELHMVTARITDLRNAGYSSSGAKRSEVPLKRYKSNEYSGINILLAILHWIWPPGRCQNCQSIYSSSLNLSNGNHQSHHHIHRTSDGRFTLEDVVDGVMVETKRLSINSQYSSSDDGGFLPKRPRITVPPLSWRRPLVQSPSELSFRSDGQNSSNRWLGLGRNLLQTIPQLHHYHQQQQQSHDISSVPINQNLHINTVSTNVPGPMISSSSNLYTPSSLHRLSRIHASSPATSSPMVNSPWSPLYFSDLSSVHPSSAERSSSQLHQQQQQQFQQIQQIQQMRRQQAKGFIPVIEQDPSPPFRSYANIGPSSHLIRSSRTRTFPRYNRTLRAVPELSSPILNLNLNILEQSPESQTSSSGFGSKNTSSQQNQSSQSGGGNSDWMRLPPYRPPPQPSTSAAVAVNDNFSLLSPSSPYSMSHWFELMQRLNLASASEFKAVDVGSVDGHYEFDHPSSPTGSTPTQQTLMMQQQHLLQSPSDLLIGTLRAKRQHLLQQQQQQQQQLMTTNVSNSYKPRYDQATIDARVQAMKEEFYAYRKRQAIKRAGIVLESAC
ncbi:hypothetical protein PVAND_014304 [Polypedilum vanderplanki]|uniref:Protein turtle n=1 Tax=Polypedilum vanderplanki TaxID=319348 RepID=A0A9J6CRX8_POLVA|nr:hypothetical protein PVAND_014304 [Polypedilum vanderplanki]